MATAMSTTDVSRERNTLQQRSPSFSEIGAMGSRNVIDMSQEDDRTSVSERISPSLTLESPSSSARKGTASKLKDLFSRKPTPDQNAATLMTLRNKVRRLHGHFLKEHLEAAITDLANVPRQQLEDRSLFLINRLECQTEYFREDAATLLVELSRAPSTSQTEVFRRHLKPNHFYPKHLWSENAQIKMLAADLKKNPELQLRVERRIAELQHEIKALERAGTRNPFEAGGAADIKAS